MTRLNIPDQGTVLEGEQEIRAYLSQRGVVYQCWQAPAPLPKDADPDTILAAFKKDLDPLMAKGGYKTADVISVYPDTEGLATIRQKFLPEHTHSEDEVRFFVEGEGLFWFNLRGDEPVFSVLCQAGDLISVPANTRHWFDLGPKAYVRAIRIFTDPAGWVANYTGSGIDASYNPEYL